MEKLIDNMVKFRPLNEDPICQTSSSKMSRHVAAIFKPSKMTAAVAADQSHYQHHVIMGLNYRLDNCQMSIHAEADALSRLWPRQRCRATSVDIIVIQLDRWMNQIVDVASSDNDNNSKSYHSDKCKLLESKPCLACALRLSQLAKLGYNLRRVYYSTEDGNIVYSKLDALLESGSLILTTSDRLRHYNLRQGPALPRELTQYLVQQQQEREKFQPQHWSIRVIVLSALLTTLLFLLLLLSSTIKQLKSTLAIQGECQ